MLLRSARFALFLFIIGYFAGLAVLALVADPVALEIAFWLTVVSMSGAIFTSVVALATQICRGIRVWKEKQRIHG